MLLQESLLPHKLFLLCCVSYWYMTRAIYIIIYTLVYVHSHRTDIAAVAFCTQHDERQSTLISDQPQVHCLSTDHLQHVLGFCGPGLHFRYHTQVQYDCYIASDAAAVDE